MMIFREKFTLITLLIAIVLGASCAGPTSQTSSSSPQSVSIPLTQIGDQGTVGFCWSYALHGLAETLAKKRDIVLNLSEEYLGLQHLLKQLQEMARAANPAEELKLNLREGYTTGQALLLVNEVGMVPEEVFNVKFPFTTNTSLTINSPAERLKDHFLTKFQDPVNIALFKSDREFIRNEMASALMLDLSLLAPNASFSFEGKTYSPVSFMHEKVGFEPQNYTERQISSDNFEYEIHILKAILLSNIPVPLGVGTFFGADGERGIWDSQAWESGHYDLKGAHAFLAVDFVTRNGHAGQMPPSDLKAVFYNPLESLLVKNSWGSVGLTQVGEGSAEKSERGFLKLTQDFLKSSSLKRPLRYLVPKDFITDQKYLLGYKLKSAILMKENVLSEGTPFALTATVLDSSTPNASDATFSWKILKDNAQVVFEANGVVVNVSSLPQGEYTIDLTTTLGEQTSQTQMPLAILKSYDVFANEIPVKVSGPLTPKIKMKASNWFLNTIASSWQTLSSAVTLNYRDFSLAEKLFPETIEFPKWELHPGQALEFSFKVMSANKTMLKQLFFEIQADFDDNSKYISLPCTRKNVLVGLEVKCSLPPARPIEKPLKATFKLMASLAKLNASEVSEELSLTDLEVKSSSPLPKYSPQSYENYAHISFPQTPVQELSPNNAGQVKFAAVGQVMTFSGRVSSQTELVKLYIDGDFMSEIPASAFVGEVGKERLVTVPYSFSEPGAHSLDLVAVHSGKENSYIRYKVMVVPKIIIQNTPETLVGENKPPERVVYDLPFSKYFNSKTDAWELTFSEISKQGKPFNVPINTNGRVAAILDLSAVNKPTLSMETSIKLNEKSDMIAVWISENSGDTFTLIKKYSGQFMKKSEEISLTPYGLKKDILLVLELATGTAPIQDRFGVILPGKGGFIHNLTLSP